MDAHNGPATAALIAAASVESLDHHHHHHPGSEVKPERQESPKVYFRKYNRSDNGSIVTNLASVATMGDQVPLKRQQLPASKPRPKKFVCEVEGCDKAYSRPCLLEQHRRSHTNERPYVCTVEGCHKAFLRDSHLKTHLLSHTDQKPLACEFCKKGFNTNQHLNRHLKTHYETYACDVAGCDARFRKHTQLRRHKSEAHKLSKRFRCTYKDCGREFNHKSRLDAHIVKTHEPYPRYQCAEPGCGEKLYTWTLLQSHTKQAHRKTPCRTCGRPCAGPGALAEHVREAHGHSSDGTGWRCEEPSCEDLPPAPTREVLVAHYRDVHSFIPQNLLQEDGLQIDHNKDSPGAANGQGDGHHPHHHHHHQPPHLASAQDAASVAAAAMSAHDDTDHMEDNKRRRLTREPTMIERISGAGYEDSGRTLACTVPGCLYRFSRKYDLDRHIAAVHPNGDGTVDHAALAAAAAAAAATEGHHHPGDNGFVVVDNVEVLNQDGEIIDPMILNQ
uniref:ARAD1C21340p n=1 Tax=Blastobotrys adeninivorans TaxID=409370 RepID=A0A060T145_BLAAD